VDHNTYLSLFFSLSLSLSLSLSHTHTHTNTHNPKTPTLINSLNSHDIMHQNTQQHKSDVHPKIFNSIQSLHSYCAIC
jgi:hypothetical protein